jgi:diaminopimelate epimerase
MQHLLYIKSSPGGNTTSLVSTKVARKHHAEVARYIMTCQPDVEQVGFIEGATNLNAAAHLQMAGNEFCGNATRALAYVLVEKKWYGLDRRIEKFFLEVSGVSRILEARVNGQNARVEMPVKCGLDSIRQIGNKTIIDLEGISHVLINHEPPAEIMYDAKRIIDELGLNILESAGVIYFKNYKDGIYITPVVWVRETGTLITETACGSGTISIALAQAMSSPKDEIVDIPVYQPSGKIIHATVQIKGGMITKAFIEGPVEILEEGELIYNLSKVAFR